MCTRDNARGRLLWTAGGGGAGGDEYTLDTAAASLTGLALWVAERTGLIAIEVPEAGLTPPQGRETARLRAALGADGCDVRISTDRDAVIEELGAIAADARVRRTRRTRRTAAAAGEHPRLAGGQGTRRTRTGYGRRVGTTDRNLGDGTAPDVVAITQPLGKRQARRRCSAGGPVEPQPRPGRETAGWSATRVRRGCETHDRDGRARATRTKSCARRRHRPQDRPPRVRANRRPSDGTGGSERR